MVNKKSILKYKEYHIDQRTAKKYALQVEKPTYKKRESVTKLEPYKALIRTLLDEANYTSKKIIEKVQAAGCELKRSSIGAYIYQVKKHKNQEATVRFENIPGCQGQVDWGHFENYKVIVDGEPRKLYCFFMILGYSRMRYIEFVTDMTTGTLLKCHQNAFRYFGGYPEEILYDNMKQVVIKRMLKAGMSF